MRRDSVLQSGHRLCYLDAGPVDGEPIVLLHGLMSDSSTWDPAIGPLAEHGLRYSSNFMDDIRPYRHAESGLVELPVVTAACDLTFEFQESGTSLRGAVEYSTALFDAGTVERMVGQLQVLLAGIVAAPDRPLGELPLLTGAERGQVLHAWNDTGLDVHEENVRIEVALPWLLAQLAGGIQSAIRKSGTLLLEKKKP